MDDLLTYLHGLFTADVDIIAAFTAAGTSTVSCVRPNQRIKPVYPRIIMEGDDGQSSMYGDVMPKFYDATLWLKVMVRKSDADQASISTLTTVKARVTELILGQPALGIQGLQGTKFSASYRCDSIQERSSKIEYGVTDPTVDRWRVSYHVKLNNLAV